MRKLTSSISYNIGANFVNIKVDGRRFNFTKSEIRGKRPQISEIGEETYHFLYECYDREWFNTSDFSTESVKEAKALRSYLLITPKTIKDFVYSKKLGKSKNDNS